MFNYEAFGLEIQSELDLPELGHSRVGHPEMNQSEISRLGSRDADLSIHLKRVDLPESSLNEGFSFKTTETAIYRFWDNVGKFKITENSIFVDPIPGLNATVLRNFLLGTVLATYLRFRGLLVIHASSINMENSAVAFSGFKGYGKSTTAMEFYREGYPVVTDDYVPVEFCDDLPFVAPGFPSLRLSNESRILMGLKLDESQGMELLTKTYAELPASFSNFKLPLKKIYILRRGEKSMVKPLKPQEAFMELVKNTFGIDMFSRSELPDNFFKCEKLLKNVDVAVLEVPSLEKMQEVVGVVEEDLDV